MAKLGSRPDLDVAGELIELAAEIVPGRVPSQEGDLLPLFVKLRLRRGHDARAREIVDHILVKVLGVPANQLIATLQEWPEAEREARLRALTIAILDPVERKRRQQANIEMLAEEVAFWEAEIAAGT